MAARAPLSGGYAEGDDISFTRAVGPPGLIHGRENQTTARENERQLSPSDALDAAEDASSANKKPTGLVVHAVG